MKKLKGSIVCIVIIGIFIAIATHVYGMLANDVNKIKEANKEANKIEKEIQKGDLYAFKQETKDSGKKLRYQINTYINENKHIENSKIGHIKLTFEDLTQNEIEYINREIENTLGFIVEKNLAGIYVKEEIRKLDISVDRYNCIYQRNNSKSLEEIKSILDNSSYGLAFGKVDIINPRNRAKAYIEIEEFDMFHMSYNLETFYYDIR